MYSDVHLGEQVYSAGTQASADDIGDTETLQEARHSTMGMLRGVKHLLANYAVVRYVIDRYLRGLSEMGEEPSLGGGNCNFPILIVSFA